MSRFTLVAVLVSLTSAGFAQVPMGEVSGRLRDEARADLPGVRVTIVSADYAQQVVTDGDGRFSIQSVPVGTYRVKADLVGFISAVGDITLSPGMPRAFLNWSLEVDCLGEVQRVMSSPKEAAAGVDAIVHLRVTTDTGAVLVSPHPACAGRAMRGYDIEILGRAAARGTASTGPRRLMLEWPHDHVQPGREYVALLSADGFASSELVLPIESGRVVSPASGELHGLPVGRALALLAEWARRKP